MAVMVTTSPSSRKVRVEPSASGSGSWPFQDSSMSEPRWSRSGPLTVPEANRSPVRSAAPLTVRCASCWAAVQYISPNGGQLTHLAVEPDLERDVQAPGVASASSR